MFSISILNRSKSDQSSCRQALVAVMTCLALSACGQNAHFVSPGEAAAVTQAKPNPELERAKKAEEAARVAQERADAAELKLEEAKAKGEQAAKDCAAAAAENANTCQARSDEAQAEIVLLIAERDAAQDEAAKCAKDAAEAAQKATDEQKRLADEAKAEKEAADKKIADLNQEKAEKDQQIANALGEIAQLRGELADALKNKAADAGQIADLTDKLGDAQKKLDEALAGKNAAEGKLKECQVALDQAQKDRDASDAVKNQRIADLEVALAAAADDLRSAYQNLIEDSNEIGDLKVALEKAKSDLAQEIANRLASDQAKDAQIEDLTEQLAKAKEDAQLLSESLDSAIIASLKLQVALEALRAELGDKNAQIAGLQAQLADANRDLAVANGRADQAEKALAGHEQADRDAAAKALADEQARQDEIYELVNALDRNELLVAIDPSTGNKNPNDGSTVVRTNGIVGTIGHNNGGKVTSVQNCALLAQLYGKVAHYTSTFKIEDGRCIVIRTNEAGMNEARYFGPQDRVLSVRSNEMLESNPPIAQIATVTIGEAAVGSAPQIVRTVLQVTATPDFSDNRNCDCGTAVAECKPEVKTEIKVITKYVPGTPPFRNWDEPINFGYNSSDLKLAALETVRRTAEMILNSYQDGNVINKIEVLGHTDPDGSDQMNQTLSEKRADSVVAALKVELVAQSTARKMPIDWSVVTFEAQGKGESEPKYCVDKTTGQSVSNCGDLLAKNRRFTPATNELNRRAEFRLYKAN